MKEEICLGCLATDKKLTNNYCSKCIKELFNGTTPNPLNFDKIEFSKKRAELSPRMSISGVQDKISLCFRKKGFNSNCNKWKIYFKTNNKR